MQPPKEIHIEVAEDKDYDERLMWGSLRRFGLCLLVFSIFSVIEERNDYAPIIISTLLFVHSNYYLRRNNRFFITRFHFTPIYTSIDYLDKSSKLINTLKGDTEDFQFRIRYNNWQRSKRPPAYLSISYQGKEVIRQFEIDNWAKQDIEQIVKDISLLKGLEIKDPALNSFSRKFIRLIFPKFNFD